MFTGRRPDEHRADWTIPLDDRYPVVAERLSQAGYATGGFAANLIYCDYEHGLTRGFQKYTDYATTPGEVLYSEAVFRTLFNSPRLRRTLAWYDVTGRQTARDVTDAFLDWTERTKGRPFFAFLNYFDAHTPVLPPEPFGSMFTTAGRDYLHD